MGGGGDASGQGHLEWQGKTVSKAKNKNEA